MSEAARRPIFDRLQNFLKREKSTKIASFDQFEELIERAEAPVVEAAPTIEWKNRVSLYSVDYSFRDSNGKSLIITEGYCVRFRTVSFLDDGYREILALRLLITAAARLQELESRHFRLQTGVVTSIGSLDSDAFQGFWDKAEEWDIRPFDKREIIHGQERIA